MELKNSDVMEEEGRKPLYCSEGHRSYLTGAFLLFQTLFRQLLPLDLHGQTHNVLTANGDELLGLKEGAKEGHGTEARMCGRP